MNKFDISKFDYNSENFEEVGKWADELQEEWTENQKIIKPYLRKKRMLEKYNELHDAWFKKYCGVAYNVNTIVLVMSILAGIVCMTITKGMSFVVAISMGVILICGLMFSIFGKIESYVPPELQMSVNEIDLYDEYSMEGLKIGHNMLIFNNRAKYLLTLDKYKNAYATIEGIAKERNCTPEDLYNQYVKKDEV